MMEERKTNTGLIVGFIVAVAAIVFAAVFASGPSYAEMNRKVFDERKAAFMKECLEDGNKAYKCEVFWGQAHQ